MTGRDLENLNLDLSRVRSRTDFLESYANTTGRELETISRRNAFPETPRENVDQSDMGWILTMDAASSLREAASWAVYFDVDRAIGLLGRAGFLYQSVGMAFGSFLLAVAGTAPLEELPYDIELLARAHGQVTQAGPVAIPDSLHHPQQQAYLLLACAGMADKMISDRGLGFAEERSRYREALHTIAVESPIRQGVVPFGALGIPVRVPWNIGIHLLQEKNSESRDIVARYIANLCGRYADTMGLATVNDYLWGHAAAPVDVGDIEVIGISALAAVHFGGEELTASITGFGVQAEGISYIPIRLGREISERSQWSPE
jgi:hypothetical protein